MNDRRKDKLKRQRELQRRRSQRRLPRQDPVIGYVARQGIHMICDGDACVVAGSRAAMVAVLEYHRCDPAEHAIEQAHCSQILQAIELGGAYAFDEQAYGRFLPEAQQAGLPLVEEDFSDPGPGPTGIHLVRIGFV